MAYAIGFAEVRTYLHTYVIDTDDELEAQHIAEQLAASSDFLCDIAGNGKYFDTKLEVTDYYALVDEGSDVEVIDFAKYTEE